MSKTEKYILMMLIAIVGNILVAVSNGSLLSFWIGFLTASFMDIVTTSYNESEKV